MTLTAVGYAYLIDAMGIQALPPKRPAMIRAVTRIEVIGDTLSVPPALAPQEGDFLEHIFFALKHEGVNLSVLSQVLPQIPGDIILAKLLETPSGAYIRQICFLWEEFTGQLLDFHQPPRGAATTLFPAARYITGKAVRNTRWRVDFNGLGSIRYCASVERTPDIQALLDLDILGKAKAFLASLPAEMMDRAISWAYLSETRESFAIEKESPSADKSERFVQLLRQAHDQLPLTEDYLVSLQNSAISNPLDMAVAFRHEQNHLSNGLRGAAGVTYVPPPPQLCHELMQELMQFANNAPAEIDPLVAAGVSSFGFVFLHPFMDGNGRLSRFLIHLALCRSGALDNGLLLPVSVAMKHGEQRYLEALQDYSKAMLQFWKIRWVDLDDVALTFEGHESVYRYWDATAQVAFTLEMARQALEVELREEAQFLENYDAVVRAVNARYDVRGSELAKLVMMCLSNNGVVSRNRRKQFENIVQGEVFDFIEAKAREQLFGTRSADGVDV